MLDFRRGIYVFSIKFNPSPTTVFYTFQRNPYIGSPKFHMSICIWKSCQCDWCRVLAVHFFFSELNQSHCMLSLERKEEISLAINTVCYNFFSSPLPVERNMFKKVMTSYREHYFLSQLHFRELKIDVDTSRITDTVSQPLLVIF